MLLWKSLLGVCNLLLDVDTLRNIHWFLFFKFAKLPGSSINVEVCWVWARAGCLNCRHSPCTQGKVRTKESTAANAVVRLSAVNTLFLV